VSLSDVSRPPSEGALSCGEVASSILDLGGLDTRSQAAEARMRERRGGTGRIYNGSWEFEPVFANGGPEHTEVEDRSVGGQTEHPLGDRVSSASQVVGRSVGCI